MRWKATSVMTMTSSEGVVNRTQRRLQCTCPPTPPLPPFASSAPVISPRPSLLCRLLSGPASVPHRVPLRRPWHSSEGMETFPAARPSPWASWAAFLRSPPPRCMGLTILPISLAGGTSDGPMGTQEGRLTTCCRPSCANPALHGLALSATPGRSRGEDPDSRGDGGVQEAPQVGI